MNSIRNRITVVVNGAGGKMGQAAVKAISIHQNLELVGALNKEDNLRENLSKLKPEVVVDLTHADVGVTNTRLILESGCRPVVGTSGFTATNIIELQELARSQGLGGIIAPNFSIGAILMMRYAKEIAKYLPNVAIIETHHEKKLDAPSGTALKTAEMIASQRGSMQATPSSPSCSADLIAGAQGAVHAGVNIHSIRLPGHLAHQKVVFGGVGESLTISHDALTRECYMPGICFACQKVVELKGLEYGLEKIM